LIVTVKYKVGGEKKEETFSTTGGDKPSSTAIEAGIQEVRVLSEDIEEPFSGEGLATLTLRLRNLSTGVAMKPTAKVEFKLDSRESSSTSKKTSSHRKSTKKKSTGPRKPFGKKKSTKKSTKKLKASKGVTINKPKDGRQVIEFKLDEGEMKSGETKIYTKHFLAPKYLGYGITVGADWPLVDETEVVYEEGAGELTGDGGEVQLGALKAENMDNGTVTLTLPVTNNGPEIGAKQLKVGLFFINAAGKEVKQINYTCLESFPKGKTVNVKITGQKVPAYERYEMSMEF
jgi:hypothetical protein